MKQIEVETLSLESFKLIGEFTNLLDCQSEYIGETPVRFYRDMIEGVLANKQASVSVVQCSKREMIIEKAEQHFTTAELLLPLDGDIIIFAAPASPTLNPDKIRAFYVPIGTMVTFDVGVWHKAPFPVNEDIVNSLVILPPLTYLKDCLVVALEEPIKIQE